MCSSGTTSPGTYPYADFLRQQREVLPPRVWASQFMNNPTPVEGAFFKAAWLRTYHNLPPRDTLKTYVAVDFAVTDAATADYTAIVVFTLDPSWDIFVLDVWRKQADAATSVDALFDMVRDWKPMVVVTEAGVLKNAIGPFLNRENERAPHLCGARDDPIPARQGSARAERRGAQAVRGLFLPQAEWRSDFVSEVLAFPAGRNDDMVDCISIFCQLLDRLIPGHAPVKKEPPKLFSTDPSLCTVTLSDLFEQADRRWKQKLAAHLTSKQERQQR